MQNDIDKVLYKLSKSKFRSSFHLNDEDREYIILKGYDTIYKHINEFISKRLAPKYIENDGRQTPVNGHSVFIAQHATATCCRSCLYKWHKFPKNVELTDYQKKYITNLIFTWINNEMNNYK